MFCSIYKFFISVRIDSGNPLGKILDNHINNCSDCRSFYSIHNRLSKESPTDFTGIGNPELEQKIISGINTISQVNPKPVKKFKPITIFASIALIASLFTGILLIKLNSNGSETIITDLTPGMITTSGKKIIDVDKTLAAIEKPLISEALKLNSSIDFFRKQFNAALDLKLSKN